MSERDDFFRRIFKVVAFGAAFASIPLFASMQNLQPPWPSAVSYISAALILVGALLARDFGEDMSRKARKRLLLVASALTVAGLFAYLYLYSTVVLTLSNGERRILGFVCNSDTQQMYGSLCPKLTELELSRAGYDPDLLFTPGSITQAKLLLFAAWVLFTAGLVAAVGWSVAGPRPPKEPPPAPIDGDS